LPKCAQCGIGLPLVDTRALYRDGKRICTSCAGISQSAITTSSDQVKSGQKAPSLKLPSLFPLVTVVLIALNIVFFVLEEARGGSENLSVLMQLGAIYQPAIQSGQYYRLVTAMFLHIGFFHLASNMYALFVIGSALERVYGHDRFIIVYLVSGLCGSILSAISIPAGIVAAGASGAILGSLAALIVLQLRFSRVSLGIGLGSAILSLSYNVISGFVPNSGIDNGAHLGGVLGGGLLSAIMRPDSRFTDQIGLLTTTAGALPQPKTEPVTPTATQQARRRSRRAVKVAVGLAIICLIALWAAFPAFTLLRNPDLDRFLTLTVSVGPISSDESHFTLTLLNNSPWPISFRNGRWRFLEVSLWIGPGPDKAFTLVPFAAYTFEFVISNYGWDRPAVTVHVSFNAEATMLYITDHDVQVTNW